MLKWPGGKAKLASIKIGIPAVILGQLLEVVDQMESIVVSVHDNEGEAQVFYSEMKTPDMAYHAMHIHDYLNQHLAGRHLPEDGDDESA